MKGSVYKLEDFDDMSLNPFAVAKGTFMWEHYDELKRRPGLCRLPPESVGPPYDEWLDSDLDKLIKFLVIFVDPESPLAKEPDYDFRREEAMNIVAVKEGTNTHDEIVAEGPVFQIVMFELFKYVNSYTYESWFSQKMNFHIMSSELRKAPAAFDATTLNARRQLALSMEELRTDLIKIESTLFPNARIEKMVSDIATEDQVGGYPEEFAEWPAWKKDMDAEDLED